MSEVTTTGRDAGTDEIELVAYGFYRDGEFVGEFCVPSLD